MPVGMSIRYVYVLCSSIIGSVSPQSPEFLRLRCAACELHVANSSGVNLISTDDRYIDRPNEHGDACKFRRKYGGKIK
jgi:hypothetical protein